jgi:DNA modification methylase
VIEADYGTFLGTKRAVVPTVGVMVLPLDVNPQLFPFQRDLTAWAARKGRAALFADTGLGKTRMQVEWARLLGVRTLIVAPLSVARQTVAEAARIGVTVTYARSGADASAFITITNYEMLEHFDPALFDAVVLDESSIIKALDGKTRERLTTMFAGTRYRLCCTATPAPNDIAEIANHAEFLGIKTRAEMLAEFFVHDDEGWRLKGHAEQAFYRWLASWGMSVRKPSDLGYPDDGYDLPPLTIEPRFIESEYRPEGMLFAVGLKGITDRSAVRRETLTARVEAAAALANGNADQWILWCGLNDEADALAALVPDAVNVQGSDSPERKAELLEAFQDGSVRVLITKPRIAGYGMNFQRCHRMAFVGLSDSWEQYYQSIRRCYRFGQTEPVEVHIVLSDAEQDIYHNVMRKEDEAKRMGENLVEHVREFERAEIASTDADTWQYETGEAAGADWRLMLGDSSERLAEIPDASIDLSVYSPPFQSLYTYSPTERDLGNSRTREQFFEHYGFIIREILRATKPGRNTCVHVQQIAAMLARDGYIGIKDFRGDVIRAYEDAGWIYHGEVCIDKDPQAQAIRTHSKGLLFVQVRKDTTWSRPALADYILLFRKPGDNVVAVHSDVSNDDWIEWARPIWYGIRESDTLQVAAAREHEDERHIAPLQLGTIERCVRLWSNPGETVLSPFAGIGSEGFESVRLGRKFIGIELKPSYFNVAVRNLQRAERERYRPTLFDAEAGTPRGEDRR